MKPSDLQIIFNGLEMVTKSFIKRNEAEIRRVWQNSSLNDISKSVASSVEEKLSSAVATNPKELAKVVTEAKERSFVVAESIRQYSSYVMKQKNLSTSISNIDKDLDIDHPIIQQEMAVHDVKDQTTSINDESMDISKTNPLNQQISQEHTNTTECNAFRSPPATVTKEFNKQSSIQNANKSPKLQFKENTTESNIFKSVPTTITEEFIKQNLIQAKPTVSKSQKLQKLSDRARERKVPASRISRLISYGGLAAGMGLGAVAEVTRRKLGFKTGRESDVNSLLTENPFLSEANANRIVDTLCKVRGAALKLGQMLSIQDNSMINPQLAAVFERVRQSADFMPSWQMEKVLKKEFGDDWREKFLEFDAKPFAAASIGQVHCAKLLDGTDVALKIQYPGVSQGIESDINSLLSIVHLWNILPKGMYVDNVMAVAKRELRKEVDYINEAKSGKMFKELLKQYPEYYVPSVYEDLCTSNVLTTELVYGTPIDKLQDSDQNLRNLVCERLLRLCLMEIFLFRFMQTDPNWANFLYNYDSNQIVLLDFGACNSYTPEFVYTYMNIIKAAAEQDRPKVLHFSQELGFLTGYETKIMEEAHVDAVMILGEAFACKKPFDFKQQNMTQRIHQLVPIMLKHRLTAPPEETYSLHRKMSGIFLLCTKLGARIDCSVLFDDIYNTYVSQKSNGMHL